jgi:hypothetical protein
MSNLVVKDVADQGLSFFDALQQQQAQEFGSSQAALNAVNSMWAPIMAGGAIPYGYSPGLDQLLQANVLQTGAQATSNAENAAALQQKQASGGANVLPTGADAAINAEIGAIGQQKTASGLQNEKIAGYEQGVTNLEDATKAELGVAGAENPVGGANATEGVGALAEKAGNDEFTENQTSSFGSIMGDIGKGVGLAGEVGGMAAGFMGPAAGGGGIGDFGALDDIQGSNAAFTAGMSPTEAAMPDTLSFHKGGIVPGRKGKEVRAKVKAGEYVIPAPKTKKQKSALDRALVNARK